MKETQVELASRVRIVSNGHLQNHEDVARAWTITQKASFDGKYHQAPGPSAEHNRVCLFICVSLTQYIATDFCPPES